MRIVRGIARELRVAARHCTRRSLPRYAADILLYRYLKIRTPRRINARRSITLKNGVTVVYRLNRGDIQTVREIWFQDTYRVPFDLPGTGGTLLDLGGNIGQAAVYLARRHRFDRIVVVEPVPENAELARLNCQINGVVAEVVQAAVGPKAGQARFAVATNHNQGRLDADAQDGLEVQVVAPWQLVGDNERVRLVKLDIEGGEDALLTGDLSWLEHVDALIAEFHPHLVDYPALVDVVKDAGFSWFRPKSYTDAFLRAA